VWRVQARREAGTLGAAMARGAAHIAQRVVRAFQSAFLPSGCEFEGIAEAVSGQITHQRWREHESLKDAMVGWDIATRG